MESVCCEIYREKILSFGFIEPNIAVDILEWFSVVLFIYLFIL